MLFGYKRQKWVLEKTPKLQGENQPVGANRVRNPEISATIAKMWLFDRQRYTDEKKIAGITLNTPAAIPITVRLSPLVQVEM